MMIVIIDRYYNYHQPNPVTTTNQYAPSPQIPMNAAATTSKVAYPTTNSMPAMSYASAVTGAAVKQIATQSVPEQITPMSNGQKPTQTILTSTMQMFPQKKKPNPSRFQSVPETTQISSAPVNNGNSNAQSKSIEPSQWPPSLKAFVLRSFTACKTEEERSFIQTELKKLMLKVANEGRLQVSCLLHFIFEYTIFSSSSIPPFISSCKSFYSNDNFICN